MVPATAPGDVAEDDVFLRHRRVALQLLSERQQSGEIAQLKNRSNAGVVFVLEDLKLIEIPRVDHQGLFADRVRVQAQGESNVGVVQVVRRADAHVLYSPLRTPRRPFSRKRSTVRPP